MSQVTLNLLVLRSANPSRSARFYEALLAIPFIQHRHGTGPEHFAGDLGSAVLEIYRQCGEHESTSATRLGFRVPCLESVIARAEEFGAKVLMPPRQSEWGTRAVIQDADGHRIELTEEP